MRGRKAFVLAIIVGLSGAARAKDRIPTAPLPGEVRTVILAKEPAPGAGTTVIAGRDRSEKSMKFVTVEFPVSALPQGAEFLYCAIRVVTADEIKTSDDEPKTGKGIYLKVRATGVTSGQLGGVSLPWGKKSYEGLILQGDTLCGALKKAKAEAQRRDAASFTLSTETPSARVALFITAPDADPSLRPRLILVYQRPPSNLDNTGLDDADWAQFRHDPQHSGRSRWAIRYPFGYTPAFGERGVGSVNDVDKRQSPLLFRGMTITAVGSGVRISGVAGFENTKAPPECTDDKTDAIAAGANGWLYRFPMACGMDVYDFSKTPPVRQALSRPEKLTETGVPTIGSDGSIYAVYNNAVHAFAPPPSTAELWRQSITASPAAPVVLSEDEATAYVLLKSSDKQGDMLVALDTASGGCRWIEWNRKNPDKTVIEPALTISWGGPDANPVPVVAGRTIYFTDAFPLGKKLFAIQDDPADANRFSGAAGPFRVARECLGDEVRKTEEPIRPRSVYTQADGKSAIVTPIVGPRISGVATSVWLDDGKLCWSTGPGANTCGPTRYPDWAGIQQVVAERPDPQNRLRLYGIIPADKPTDPKQLALIEVTGLGTDTMAIGGSAQDLPKLGQNLILGPAGTLYSQAPIPDGIQAIDAFPPALMDMKLTSGALGKANDATWAQIGVPTADCQLSNKGTPFNRTSFRANRIALQKDICLPPGADIVLAATSGITFGPDFHVKAGARLRAGVAPPPGDAAGPPRLVGTWKDRKMVALYGLALNTCVDKGPDGPRAILFANEKRVVLSGTLRTKKGECLEFHKDEESFGEDRTAGASFLFKLPDEFLPATKEVLRSVPNPDQPGFQNAILQVNSKGFVYVYPNKNNAEAYPLDGISYATK